MTCGLVLPNVFINGGFRRINSKLESSTECNIYRYYSSNKSQRVTLFSQTSIEKKMGFLSASWEWENMMFFRDVRHHGHISYRLLMFAHAKFCYRLRWVSAWYCEALLIYHSHKSHFVLFNLSTRYCLRVIVNNCEHLDGFWIGLFTDSGHEIINIMPEIHVRTRFRSRPSKQKYGSGGRLTNILWVGRCSSRFIPLACAGGGKDLKFS